MEVLLNNFYVPHIWPPDPDLAVSLVNPYTIHLKRLITFYSHYQELRPNIEYLGHVTHNKSIKAIQIVPQPNNIIIYIIIYIILLLLYILLYMYILYNIMNITLYYRNI